MHAQSADAPSATSVRAQSTGATSVRAQSTGATSVRAQSTGATSVHAQSADAPSATSVRAQSTGAPSDRVQSTDTTSDHVQSTDATSVHAQSTSMGATSIHAQSTDATSVHVQSQSTGAPKRTLAQQSTTPPGPPSSAVPRTPSNPPPADASSTPPTNVPPTDPQLLPPLLKPDDSQAPARVDPTQLDRAYHRARTARNVGLSLAAPGVALSILGGVVLIFTSRSQQIFTQSSQIIGGTIALAGGLALAVPGIYFWTTGQDDMDTVVWRRRQLTSLSP
ncbi:MAG TPA: hypothetical protein VHB97_19300 [Polyangia bacterium]|nr:hypothetical protein [Polyangia bacterium]